MPGDSRRGTPRAILRHEVSPYDLLITRNISQVPSEYRTNTLEASAASQLVEAGRELHAGEGISYVISSHRSRSRKFRTTPQELISPETRYDAERYVEPSDKLRTNRVQACIFLHV